MLEYSASFDQSSTPVVRALHKNLQIKGMNVWQASKINQLLTQSFHQRTTAMVYDLVQFWIIKYNDFVHCQRRCLYICKHHTSMPNITNHNSKSSYSTRCTWTPPYIRFIWALYMNKWTAQQLDSNNNYISLPEKAGLDKIMCAL